jgi:ABC-type multidrug transport system ATPase subunit
MAEIKVGKKGWRVKGEEDETILRARSLGKRYGGRWAVHDLDLTVRRGEIYGFLGPNGAGKSTTIRMLLSLVRPTSGSVELFGLPLREHRAAVLSRVGGLVERADFYPYLSARRNLRIIAALAGAKGDRPVDRALELAGLSARADDRVASFSHGMKQRLGLAGALLGSPEFVILDEPTTGLDPQGIKEVRELLKGLAADEGLTVFLSSHLLVEIEQIATSMAIINDGRLVVQGKVRELLDEASGPVVIEASPVDHAMEVVRATPWGGSASASGNQIRVQMPAADVPALNAALVAAGVAVRSLVPRRSLEEYFLSVTEGGTEKP